MKGPLPVFVAAVLAALSCGADSPSETVTCANDGGDAAAHLAVHHINQHHHRGYKYRLSDIKSSTVDKDGSEHGCTRELQLELLEPECHAVNPCPYQSGYKKVTANCNVTVNIKDDIANVTKYECNTEPLSLRDVARMCPDCPTLLPLNDPEDLKFVRAGLAIFFKNTTHQSYYRLLEVGRMTALWMPLAGRITFAYFTIVETHCPKGAKISPEACVPLCPDRAHSGSCSSSWLSKPTSSGTSVEWKDVGDVSVVEEVDGKFLAVRCELYEPKNTTLLEPGQQEPMCEPPPHLGHGFVPRGPPAPAVQVQLPEAASPPPPPGPPAPLPCDGAVISNPAIHPICPWPHQHLPRGTPPTPETA